MLRLDAVVCLFSVAVRPGLRRCVKEGMVGIGAAAGLHCTSSVSGTPPWVLRDCGQRRHVTGTGIDEVAEVDGGGRDNRQPFAYRDHRSAGAAEVPVGVGSHGLGHPAKVWVGQSGQMESVIVADARAVLAVTASFGLTRTGGSS